MPDPVQYMQRTREYYFAQGFDKAYQWAQHNDIPWQPLQKPLSQSTVAFVTTAVPDGTIAKLSRSATSLSIGELPIEFRTDELSWDKESTHTDDVNSFIPMEAMESLAEEGVIGQLAPRFHFVPTDYSQRNTNEIDALKILEACLQDEVDVAILVPL